MMLLYVWLIIGIAVCSGEKDLILLGIFHTSMNISETIGYFKPKDVSKERKRSRNVYYIRSKRVCTKTFRFLHV